MIFAEHYLPITVAKKCKLAETGTYCDYEVLAIYVNKSDFEICGYLCQNATGYIFNLIGGEYDKYKKSQEG